MTKPILHALLMGQSGVGKDTFAATWPGPINVWHLDGIGQDMPYINNKVLGRAKSVSDFLEYRLGDAVIQYRDIVMANDKFVRVEYFSSDNPTYPNAAPILEARMSHFSQEQNSWGTLVCGSLSSAALESRLNEQFVLNPAYKDPRKWYGAATEFVERLIMMQKSLRCNVVFICHVNKDKDEVGGELVYGPDLPGRLSWGAARYFNEVYHLYVMTGENGERARCLQTEHDGRYISKTHIDAPNPCYPSYASLWTGWGD
jgi:hypothetical protein